MATLYIVATPIGNLKDITLRALEVIKEADYLLCEDTRVTGKLINHYQITKKMIPFNEFNEISKISSVIADITSGKNIVLISDAGTPLISDPGYKLIREAILKNIKIESIPGPSAVITALTVSGLPPDKFIFIGFLPKKEAKKKDLLLSAKKSRELIKSTIIIYEAPYRILRTLESINHVFGDIDVVVCRELTKMHEEIVRGRITEVINSVSRSKIKGEFVILF